MEPATHTDVLFIGGRSGVGKTTVAAEVSRILAGRDIRHALIEGDNLDQAHPPPWKHGLDLAEQNLAAMWRNYRAAGYARLVFTNTVSVLEMSPLAAVLGADVQVIGVLLTASDETADHRLGRREIGSDLEAAIERSKKAAVTLNDSSPAAVHRVPTDGRKISDIAAELVDLTGWA